MLHECMDGLQILEIIKKINPWYKTGIVPESKLEEFKRREFSYLEKDLNKLDMATLLIGARRVGKSVLMYQLIDKLLKSGVPRKHILFIQGDIPVLNEFAIKGNLLNFLLDIYQKYILDASFEDLTETIYVLIDEAQIIPNWETEIKTLIDQKYKIKFIITGSSSFELRRGAQNPLTGRVSIHSIFPFSFPDYYRYNLPNGEKKTFGDKLDEVSNQFKNELMNGNITGVYESAKKAQAIVDTQLLNKNFDRYLFCGGFPWVIFNNDSSEHSKYLRDLLTTTISKDIMTQVGIREPQSFERLMVNLCLTTGSLVKFKTLADLLGIDERSVAKYVDYYVDSHWAFVSSPYAFHNRADSVKSEKKIYIIDSGIINTLSFKDEKELSSDRTYRGHIVENVIHNHLLSFKQLSIGTFQSSIPFWIESESNKEIDFIFEIKSGIVPIEVKQKVSHDGSDSQTVKTFLSKRTTGKFGILTTQDTLGVEENILLIPHSLFVMLL
jgi:predicted AAA+ superfamily ATPase